MVWLHSLCIAYIQQYFIQGDYMKNIFSALFLIGVSLLCAAPSVRAADTLKIGVFDLQRVLAESKTIDSYRKQLAKNADAKNSLFSEKQNALRQSNEKLQKDGPRLQSGERKALEEKLQRDIKELQRMKEDMELELKKADRELSEKSLKAINLMVDQIYEKESYSIIFEKSAAGVVKFRNTMDITDKVIKAYDTK